MKSAELKQVLKYLIWKLEHNDDSLDYIQIAKYMNIDHREAEKVIDYLHRKHYLTMWYNIKCPECGHYTEISEQDEKEKYRCSYWECCSTWSEDIIMRKSECYYKINRNKLFKKKEYLYNITPFRGKGDYDFMATGDKIKVFLSYSHRDEEYKKELDKHLAVQRKSGKIETWNDRKLVAGTHIHEEIDEKLIEADLIILLLSSDFFDSDYCYGRDMSKALELNDYGKNIIVPVIVRPCDWLDSPLRNIVALPEDGRPISKWGDVDEAYLNVVNGIKKAIAELG